jgi:thymidine kinase
MVKLIVGKKGTGKTKQLLDDIKTAVEKQNGNVIFINASDGRMYGVDLSVRLINAKEYTINNYNEFLCFISGASSQNYDITNIFIDGLFKIVGEDIAGISDFVKGLNNISEKSGIAFTVTVSADKADIPEDVYEYIA